jgi:hypothetical protein
MLTPDRRETTLAVLAFVWFFVVGPLALLLSISLGMPPAMRVWIGWAHTQIFTLLGGAAVFLYTRRVAREMGVPGMVVTGVWIGLVILLAGAIMFAGR